ncbi:MAG: FkbM family methyltransferase [Alphaproteobacteria bacterium]|mgnify:CR=1 FL=1|jgi:FkbM family methyltransferase|nr:FkbM family methyltransferase [Alphaproteobacteria bacterium]MDP6517284.1 FkbM family methyltransferase [Alphaproteobacteria bacterium]|tara:strand:- start:44 stop:814 length:771 start_codon:yes stop_codon:yes gene_type:complete
MAIDLTLAEYENIHPVLVIGEDENKVRYCTPNQMAAWRVQTFFTKEPETVAWIEGFSADEVLVDVGANVGMYTIWAAKTAGARVFSFEPESQNYALLNRNIVLNRLSSRVVAYCAALSDETAFDVLNLSRFDIGQSCHAFGEAVNFRLEPHQFALTQGAFATQLDELVQSQTVPTPNHIKIDVDGIEHKVIAGAKTTLENPVVKSILVEINQNLAEHVGAVTFLKDIGFTYSIAQVTEAERLDGVFKGVANYVFRR